MTDVPRDPEGLNDEADAELDDLDEDDNPDSRYTKRRWDKYIEKDGELSDSEDDESNSANGVRRQPNAPKRRRNMMDYQNPLAAPDDHAPPSGAGSGRNSLGSLNESETFDGEDSLDEGEGDEDVDMADRSAVGASAVDAAAQEATPPESPPVPAVGEVMDEAGTPEREVGREEREREDEGAEAGTERAERAETGE